jgi:serine-type D-Ala-D-Ala endopeptidase (penicillin-binding protein 7)
MKSEYRLRAHPWARKLLLLAAPTLLFAAVSHAAPSVQASQTEVVRAPTLESDSSDAVQARAKLPFGKPEVKSASVLVMDEENASVLYSKQADRVVPIASITKLMTALVVLDGQQPLDEVLELTREDRDAEAHSRLAIGAKLTRGDLLHLALMSSENRAAHALGRNYPGGLPAFIRTMNVKAKALEMKTAHFVDPTGLSNKNVSSASDLAKLVIAASRDPDIRRFSTDERYTVKVGKQLIEYRNTNTLVSKPNWDITVQKTGFTNDAGRCLVMKSTIQDRPVVMILLNSFGKYTRVADASRVRKWMEANFQPPRLAQQTLSAEGS